MQNMDGINNKTIGNNISSGYMLQIDKLYRELENKKIENIKLRNKLEKYQESDEIIKTFLRNIGINNINDLIDLKIL